MRVRRAAVIRAGSAGSGRSARPSRSRRPRRAGSRGPRSRPPRAAPRDRVAVGDDDDARPDRQHVAAERRVLLLRDLDEPDVRVRASSSQRPTGRSGRKTTATSSATGEMTDRRWTSSAGPRQYGTSKIADVAADDLGELAGARVVRPQRSTDAEQVRPEPERVAAFDRRRAPRSGRRSGSRPPSSMPRRASGSPDRFGLPGRSGIAPRSRDQQRIERVDEVRIVGLGVEDVDRRAEPIERLDEPVVLALGAPRGRPGEGTRGRDRRTRARTPARAA